MLRNKEQVADLTTTRFVSQMREFWMCSIVLAWRLVFVAKLLNQLIKVLFCFLCFSFQELPASHCAPRWAAILQRQHRQRNGEVCENCQHYGWHYTGAMQAHGSSGRSRTLNSISNITNIHFMLSLQIKNANIYHLLLEYPMFLFLMKNNIFTLPLKIFFEEPKIK